MPKTARVGLCQPGDGTPEPSEASRYPPPGAETASQRGSLSCPCTHRDGRLHGTVCERHPDIPTRPRTQPAAGMVPHPGSACGGAQIPPAPPGGPSALPSPPLSSLRPSLILLISFSSLIPRRPSLSPLPFSPLTVPLSPLSPLAASQGTKEGWRAGGAANPRSKAAARRGRRAGD